MVTLVLAFASAGDDVQLGAGSGGVRVKGTLAEAHWRYCLLRRRPKDATSFAAELRRRPLRDTDAAATQFISRIDEAASLVVALREQEGALNRRLFALYELVDSDIARIKTDCAGRLGL